LSAEKEGLPIASLLKQAGLVATTSEAMRMIEQGAVKIDGERIEDKKSMIACDSAHVFQVGKRRFARVHLIPSEKPIFSQTPPFQASLLPPDPNEFAHPFNNKLGTR
jgi:ribosome-associated protein YbcJ (S4-like RNA binding protein)